MVFQIDLLQNERNFCEYKSCHLCFCLHHHVNPYTMKKKGVLQLTLQPIFWVAYDTCYLMYLYEVSANKQVAWVVQLQFIMYTMQFIVTQLQLYQNN
jgi:hypothetical protein